jgi:hypothetical protein
MHFMRRSRGLLVTRPALVAVLLLFAAAPASAAGHPAASNPSAAAPLVDDVLAGDSCVISQGTLPYECVAVGYYLAGNVYPGLSEYSNGGAWTSSDNVGDPPGPNEVTIGGEVSCAVVTSSLPACLMVGEHYDYGGTSVQLAEWGGPDYFTVVLGRNPRGATWSAMDDVSCPASNFCMVVGAAGRKGTSHATAYIWNGRFMHELSVPAPRRSHDVELGGLSCPSTKNCVAVGNYKNQAGKFLSYAAIWTSGSWKLQETPNVAGETGSLFNAVSCPSAASCMAVGYAYRGKQDHTFAERWNGSTWRIVATPARSDSSLSSVSCPVTGTCFASGTDKDNGLIEKWNGTGWSVMKTAGTRRPESGDNFVHVSCVSATSCAAVGYRFNANPKVRLSDRTLAERWNGKTWTLQSSVNE